MLVIKSFDAFINYAQDRIWTLFSFELHTFELLYCTVRHVSKEHKCFVQYLYIVELTLLYIRNTST